jgi:glutamate 5-kinase
VGTICLDQGAVTALRAGKSLLPAGVKSVTGAFERGDPVLICDPDNATIGIGLTRYTAAEATQIKGCQSQQIEAILGYPGRAALIHRDDLAFEA